MPTKWGSRPRPTLEVRPRLGATRKAHDAPWCARRPQPGARAHLHAQLLWELRKLNMHLSIERVRLKLTQESRRAERENLVERREREGAAGTARREGKWERKQHS
jgi:hypothetical protein